MEDVETMYRAMLGRIYARKLLGDIERLSIIHDGTTSCAALATAVAAAAWDKVDAVYPVDVEVEVDNALIILSPRQEGMAERAASALRKVKKFAALHTPVFYALDEIPAVAELLKGKEVRFAVRESPSEITFYKVYLEGDELKTVAYDKWPLSTKELEVVKKFEASKR